MEKSKRAELLQHNKIIQFEQRKIKSAIYFIEECLPEIPLWEVEEIIEFISFPADDNDDVYELDYFENLREIENKILTTMINRAIEAGDLASINGKVRPEVFLRWAVKQGLYIPNAWSDWLEIKTKVGKNLPENPTEFTHKSELLDILIETIGKFWEYRPKDKPLKQITIIGWLKEKYPDLTTKELEAIELIARPNRNKRGQKDNVKYP